jgi:hypothetical protein
VCVCLCGRMRTLGAFSCRVQACFCMGNVLQIEGLLEDGCVCVLACVAYRSVHSEDEYFTLPIFISHE